MGFLGKVIELKKKEIEGLKPIKGELERLASERDVSFSFEKALAGCRTKIIAEVKKSSPSAGRLKMVEPSKQAKIYEDAGAVAISVLTEEHFFSGSISDLEEVRKSVSLPVLRKDFVLDELQILQAKAYGADAILLIVRILTPERLKELVEFSYNLGVTPLVEVFSLEEAKMALDAGAKVIGINNRDLDTLRVDVSLTKRLAPRIKELGAPYVVSESGIDSREQIVELMNHQVDAFLIGTSLMKSENPARKLKELLGF